ncbi:MAG: hypothetical protein IPF58_07640 [Saprospirales bacterium]|nr:hypothetical protein [Saprospirales bacterium]
MAVQASNQCVDTATKQIRVFDFPIVDFTVSPTQCVNKEIQFTDISSTPDGTPINDWKWYFLDNLHQQNKIRDMHLTLKEIIRYN